MNVWCRVSEDSSRCSRTRKPLRHLRTGPAMGRCCARRARVAFARAVNVRYGSLADIAARSRHVRFTLDSGHSSVQLGCPLRARSRRKQTFVSSSGMSKSAISGHSIPLGSIGLLDLARVSVRRVEKLLSPNGKLSTEPCRRSTCLLWRAVEFLA
jgi:DNA-binding transcriptional ArsR family regulator